MPKNSEIYASTSLLCSDGVERCLAINATGLLINGQKTHSLQANPALLNVYSTIIDDPSHHIGETGIHDAGVRVLSSVSRSVFRANSNLEGRTGYRPFEIEYQEREDGGKKLTGLLLLVNGYKTPDTDNDPVVRRYVERGFRREVFSSLDCHVMNAIQAQSGRGLSVDAICKLVEQALGGGSAMDPKTVVSSLEKIFAHKRNGDELLSKLCFTAQNGGQFYWVPRTLVSSVDYSTIPAGRAVDPSSAISPLKY